MKIVFRADSSTQLGIGHIMRCLTLADLLHENGCQVAFICRELPGNENRLIEKKGYRLHRLPCEAAAESSDASASAAFLKQSSPVDWLVVDQYELDSVWEKEVRPYATRLMVIDDLANRKHACDLLLDQNLYERLETRYDHLLAGECTKLLGSNYALLRPEFSSALEQLTCRRGTVRRILIFYGGSDPTNETVKALEAVRLLGRPDISVDVVVGEANSNRTTIEAACEQLTQVCFHCQINNIAQFMANADLCIGAVGSATWERFCLGLPALTTIIADNQRQLAIDLGRQGLIFCLGDHGMVTAAHILAQLALIIESPGLLLEMQRKTMALVDGRGAKRVAAHLLNAC